MEKTYGQLAITYSDFCKDLERRLKLLSIPYDKREVDRLWKKGMNVSDALSHFILK